MDSIATVHAAILTRDWITVRLMLHPYLHWTDTSGHVVRGRSKVLTMLAEIDPPALPSEVEWRDGQVYRWTA